MSPRALVPGWIAGYRRAWLLPDVIAGIVIWSVVVPQAVAYAQIAGLPPEAGLMAAPGAMLAYALIGTSRSLVVSATTATSALSASTIGPMAAGDPVRFAALSAGFALVTGVVLILGGVLRFGAVADFVSKPVMTGFLFGLGLTVAIGQLPAMFGVPAGSGAFFARAWDLVEQLDDTRAWTLGTAALSLAGLVVLKRVAPRLPGSLIVLVAAIAISHALDLAGHGVDVVGDIPSALPDPTWPGISAGDAVDLIAPAFGVLVMTAEAVGVARGLATRDGYRTDPNRDLVAMGASNLVAGFSGGFVQSGGASQTAAADQAGGRSQLASAISAGLILLTGAFLAFLFEDLPQATLAAIVIVAIASFFDVAGLRRVARIRRSAIVLALTALGSVLLLGVLQGLVVTAVASLVLVIKRISRPRVTELARDPGSGMWGRVEARDGWERTPGVLVTRSEGLLLYPNAVYVRELIRDEVAGADPPPRVVVMDLSQNSELDVETLDALTDLHGLLAREGVELRLAGARSRTAELLRRAGVPAPVYPTIDEAVAGSSSTASSA